MRLKSVLTGFGIGQGAMAVLFAAASLLLPAVAARTGWQAVAAGLDRHAAAGSSMRSGGTPGWLVMVWSLPGMVSPQS